MSQLLGQILIYHICTRHTYVEGLGQSLSSIQGTMSTLSNSHCLQTSHHRSRGLMEKSGTAIQDSKVCDSHNLMEPQLTSLIFMLIFLIIRSAAISDYDFYVIRLNFNP